MYSYRSIVTHGGKPEFTGELQVLGGHSVALKLVEETTKKVVRYAPEEPQLIKDLKEC